jgi:O2-independent ubiquinone biosynthesis protein UbiV
VETAPPPAERDAEITLGPILFNWAPERWRDFYFRIADEAPVGTVYLGEVVCAKRAPLFAAYLPEVAERLEAAGKRVVLSTPAQVVHKIDRQQVEQVCATENYLVEANDGSALLYLRGRPHHIGPFVNAYNERSAALLARNGARNFCLPMEMPAHAIRAFCDGTRGLETTVEVQVFGRVPLAISARCYHARAHHRSKDSCQYVCDEDADGLELKTLEGRPFLTVNGIQTLSYEYLNLLGEIGELRASGVTRFRLSPHDCDMVAVASVFRDALDREMEAEEVNTRLGALKLAAPFSNGFYRGKPGYTWTTPASA